MAKHSQGQDGSGLLVVVIILVIALLGALGFIFWQNFANTKDDSPKTVPVVSNTEKSEESLVVKSKVGDQEVSLAYPSDWNKTVEGSGDNGGFLRTKLTSSDGTVVIHIDHSTGFYGDGGCGNSDSITLYDAQDVSSTDKLKVVSIVYEFPAYGTPGDAAYQPKTYGYIAAILRANALSGVGVGTSICKTLQGDVFDASYTTFGYNKPAVRIAIKFPTLEVQDGMLKDGVDASALEAFMQTPTYKQAVKVLQSFKG